MNQNQTTCLERILTGGFILACIIGVSLALQLADIALTPEVERVARTHKGIEQVCDFASTRYQQKKTGRTEMQIHKFCLDFQLGVYGAVERKATLRL